MVVKEMVASKRNNDGKTFFTEAPFKKVRGVK
jgi:hypothetical protein